MRLLQVSTVGMAILGTAAVSSADMFTVSLPELVGVYGDSRTASFDFGTSFQSIAEVRMHWVGTLTPGLGHGDGVIIPEDEWFPWPTQIGAEMDPPGPGFWYRYVGPVDGPFEAEEPFESFQNPTWDFLLDGQGTVDAFLAPVLIPGGVMVEPPSGEITDAYLVLEGVVPEPTTLSLLAVGGLLVTRRRSWYDAGHRAGKS